jgi:hypothetical protein
MFVERELPNLNVNLARLGKQLKRYNDACEEEHEELEEIAARVAGSSISGTPYLIDIDGETHEVMHCRSCGVTFTMEAGPIDLNASAYCTCPNCGAKVCFHATSGHLMCQTCWNLRWPDGHCDRHLDPPDDACGEYRMVNAMTAAKDAGVLDV